MIVTIVRSFYIIFSAIFAVFFFKNLQKSDLKKESGNVYIASAIGFIANFCDALGIGSFAVSTVLLRLFKQLPDRLLPGTLNVMCILPTFLEASLYIGIIQTDYLTFVCMVLAAYIGGRMGANYVAKLPECHIQFGMAIALFLAATVMLLNQFHLIPMVNEGALGVRGISLIIATVFSLVIGALVNIGIGCFAPCLSLAFLLGISAKAIFPIMMAAAAMCSYGSSFAMMRYNAYSKKVTLCMAIFGMLGVIVAVFIVKSLSLPVLTWLVMAIVYYSSASLFMASNKSRKLVRQQKLTTISKPN